MPKSTQHINDRTNFNLAFSNSFDEVSEILEKEDKQLRLEINKAIVKGSSIVLSGLFLGKLLNMPVTVFLARYFGPQDYGVLILANTVTGMIASISVLGMGMGASRFVPLYRGNKDFDQLWGTLCFGAKTVMTTSLIATLFILMGSEWISNSLFKEPQLKVLIRIMSVAIPFMAMLQYGNGIFRGLKKLQYIVYSDNLANPILKLCAVSAVWYLSLQLNHYAFLFVIISIATMLFALQLGVRDKGLLAIRKQKAKANINKFVRYSLPLAATVIFKFTRRRFDLLIIGVFLTTDNVGIYNAAMVIALLLNLPLIGINRILLPVASELYAAGKKQELIDTYKMISRWCLTCVFPIFLIFLFFSEDLISFVYGKAFIESANVLRLLAFAICLNVSMGSFGEYLQVFGKSITIMMMSLTGGVVSLLGLFLLVPHFQVIGAALSFSISLAVMIGIGIISLAKHGIHPFGKKYILVIILNCCWFGGIFGIITLVHLNDQRIEMIFALILTSLLFYYFIIYYTGIISQDEKILMRKLIVKLMPKWSKNKK